MYNTLRVFLFTLTIAATLIAQDIPNSGFETWVNGNPASWTTTNVPTIITPVTQSNDSHSGSSAARMEVLDFSGFPFPPTLVSSETGEFGFPMTGRPGSLTGFYKFSPQGSDVFEVIIALYKNSLTEVIGGGTIIISSPASEYTQFTVPIEYVSAESPDTAYIAIIIQDTTGGENAATVGSIGYVDDLAFGGATAVEEDNQLVKTFSLAQNYPNPFNPVTTISFNIAETSPVSLKIFDVLGNEVRTLINSELSPGLYNVPFSGAELSSGVYYYTLTAGNFISTKKMVMLK